MKHLMLSLAIAAGPGLVAAQSSPVGLWKTIDDDTHKESSYVRISQAGGVFTGRVEKIIDASKQDGICDLCTDERKGQRILGLTIMRNVRQSADTSGMWDGGDILDPENGKVYRVRLKPMSEGRKLEVRGYIGMPMLGRTQTWIRVE